ncbi:amidohydrolase family protein [Streptosporangium saharense]|uniref:amidohydrolase family protein n=1 Tax=Streptosporangium saharense TaxID=1706840 RepID=UPI00368D774D
MRPQRARFRRTRDAAEVLDRLERVRLTAATHDSGRIRVMPSATYTVNTSDELGRGLAAFADRHRLPIGGMAEAMCQTWLTHNELFSDNTAVVPTDALAMATRLGARALLWEEEIGSLQVGRRADLVLVRPFEGFLVLGGSTDVGTVIVDGRILVSSGQVTRVPEQAVRERFVTAVTQIAERLFRMPAEPPHREVRP